MINLAVINLKTFLKKAMKIIITILIFAMIIKFALLIYYTFNNFDIESFSINSNIEMIKNNITISKYFEECKYGKNDELKKILVAQLAVFLGSEEEIMEKENQEDVIEFDTVLNEQSTENTVAQIQEEAKQEEGQSQIENPRNDCIRSK